MQGIEPRIFCRPNRCCATMALLCCLLLNQTIYLLLCIAYSYWHQLSGVSVLPLLCIHLTLKTKQANLKQIWRWQISAASFVFLCDPQVTANQCLLALRTLHAPSYSLAFSPMPPALFCRDSGLSLRRMSFVSHQLIHAGFGYLLCCFHKPSRVEPAYFVWMNKRSPVQTSGSNCC